MRRAAIAALASAVVAAAGCGGDSGSTTKTQTVERTTRVEVLKSASRDGASAAFDPQRIYERESPGVVTVLASGLQSGGRSGSGLGSGFVVDGNGEIATNAHVVTTGVGQSIRKAANVFVRFQDGNQVPAEIRGFDPFSDVALIKVDPKGLTLRPLPLGSVRDVRVGEPVAAIGSPFGEEQSLSVGVISATGRSIESLTGFETAGALQTDAAINSGNSGGPLLNADGQVLGINSQIRTSSGDGSGVGFAVPVNVVARSLEQLRRDGRVRYAYLGVSTRGVYPQLAERFKLGTAHGAWVQQVVPGGPADDAGLKAGDKTERFQESDWRVGGDVIVKAGRRDIVRDTDLGEELINYDPGATITLDVVRNGQRRQVRVRLGSRPLESPRG